MASLGDRVRTLRERKGWSQRHLGRVSKVRHALISELERNEIQWLSSDNLLRLARAFGVTMEQLMEGEQYEERGPAGVDERGSRATPDICNFQETREATGV